MQYLFIGTMHQLENRSGTILVPTPAIKKSCRRAPLDCEGITDGVAMGF